MASSKELHEALRKYFGFDSFRDGQEEAVRSVVEGRDTLVVMPTGGGKSLCFQLPALVSEGCAIVISPLIALMKDQSDALERREIPATFVNSSLTASEIDERLRDSAAGAYKMIYVAPERLGSRKFEDFLSNANVSFVAVDEAHCVSEWGHDFRPAYLRIIDELDKVGKFQTVALTATATPDVQQDIIKILKMNEPLKFVRGFDRPNLSYISKYSKDKSFDAASVIKEINDGSSIIYCGSRKQTETIAAALRSQKIETVAYHAGMPQNARKYAQDSFVSGKAKAVAATNAFGMGIDKPDVRSVIHCYLPQTLEAYYQEAGRAGRDGNPSDCVMLHNKSDRKLQEFFLNSTYPFKDEIETVYETLYDLNSVGLGEKSNSPIYLDDYEIASGADLSLYSAQSSLKLLEREGIISRASSSTSASLQITASRERIREYMERQRGERRTVLEALLRSVTPEAFEKPVSFDLPKTLRKYDVTRAAVDKYVRSFEAARVINFIPPAGENGIILALERMPFKNLPIDFTAFYERRRRAEEKIDAVDDYAKTYTCKRNYILNYFGERDVKGVCGRCSSCKSEKSGLFNPKRRIRKTSEVDETLFKTVLKSIGELNGLYGIKMNVNVLRGEDNIKIRRRGLENAQSYGLAAHYSEDEIRDCIDKALAERYLSKTRDKYRLLSITRKATAYLGQAPSLFKPANNSPRRDDLYVKLSNLRDDLAARERIDPRALLSDRTVLSISRERPRSVFELSQIDGVGKVFLSRYGLKFIAEIREFSKPSPIPTKVVKIPPAVKLFLDEFRAGKSIDEVAEFFNVSKGTVAGKIEKAVASGARIDRSLFVSGSDYRKIFDFLQNLPQAALKEIRSGAEVDIDFALLRIAAAFAKREIGV